MKIIHLWNSFMTIVDRLSSSATRFVMNYCTTDLFLFVCSYNSIKTALRSQRFYAAGCSAREKQEHRENLWFTPFKNAVCLIKTLQLKSAYIEKKHNQRKCLKRDEIQTNMTRIYCKNNCKDLGVPIAFNPKGKGLWDTCCFYTISCTLLLLLRLPSMCNLLYICNMNNFSCTSYLNS